MMYKWERCFCYYIDSLSDDIVSMLKEYAKNSRYKQYEVVDEIKELYNLQFQNNPDNDIDKEKVMEIVKAYYTKIRKCKKIFVNTYEV